ncbi:MAG: DUF1947 domain-containing protein [Candidatus Helarchaeota archaeon]
MKIKNRHFLKTKDVKKLQIQLQERYPNLDKLFEKDTRVETGFLEDGTVLYFIKGELTFFTDEKHILPFIRVLLKNLIILPQIVVDTGAVPYIVKGADVMIPGIVHVDETIKKNGYVVIVDEKHGKPLAVGLTLMDSAEIKAKKKGKAVKNLHYIGDRIWDIFSNR